MPFNKAPQRRIQGIRGSIPSGYLLGRVSAGEGDVELVSTGTALASGLIPSTAKPVGPAGGDLAGTYPNPSVVQLRGRLLNSTAPTDGQVLTWVAGSSDIEWKTPSAGVIIAPGVPSSFQPAGTLDSRSDAAGLYTSTSTTSTPAIVQSSKQDNNSVGSPKSITFGSAVTAGNLLIAILSDQTTTIATASAGWTMQSSVVDNVGLSSMAIYTRTAVGGDGTTPPAVVTNGAGGSSGWLNYEISGATWASLDGSVVGAGVNTPPATTVMSSFTPSVSNDLVLTAVADFKATFANQPTIGTPFTNDQQGAFFRMAEWSGHDISPAAGTPIAATITWGASSTTGVYMVFGLKGTNTAAWTLVGPAPVHTQQVFLSGTAATYNTPAGCRQIIVTIKAGGASGAVTTQTGALGPGTNGNDSIFNSIHAAGGLTPTVQAGGQGGTGGTGSANRRIPGLPGSDPIDLVASASAATIALKAGNGGGPGGGIGTFSANGTDAATNSGAGGAGGGGGIVSTSAGAFGNTERAGGGGEGETAILIINSPASTYVYTVGAAVNGAAASLAWASGKGAAGYIIVDEYY